MKRFIGTISVMAIFTLLLLQIFLPTHVSAEGGKLVYVIPVEQEIEQGLEKFLERGFQEAEDSMADVIVLEINTLGGAIDAAFDIGELIQQEDIPVVAYIKTKAISAGSYISLNADKIYMTPESIMGAAAVRTLTGDEADPKVTSVWVKAMRKAATNHGRNPDVVEGMVNPDVEIPGLLEKGDLLTLNASEAKTYGIADDIVQSRGEVLDKIGMKDASVVEVKISPAEKLARFVTSPIVIPILLIIGIAGLLIELFVPGFGFPGIIGISSFALYFFGHYIAGFAGWESIIFFLAGVILMVIELFVPGFGVFGILGIISFIMGISLAAYDTTYGLFSIVMALVINVIVLLILIKYFGKKGVWNRFILKDEQKKESGYVSHNKDKKLVGMIGKTLTKLRPSGVAIIDGKRYDVISEGSLIDANKEIEVIMVEGTRIVVKEIG